MDVEAVARGFLEARHHPPACACPQAVSPWREAVRAMLTLICSELVSHRPQVAKAAAAACADSILSDVGITSLLKQMYCSPEWQQGQVTATLVRPSPMPCYIKQYFTPFMGSDGKWCQGVDKNAPDVKPAE